MGLVVMALVTAACGGSDTASQESTAAPAADGEGVDGGEGGAEGEIVGSAGASDEAAAWAVPPELPKSPTGSLGFDRYVYVRDDDEQVIPVLVEGPARQVRCQDPDLPCSYADLAELAASGRPIPSELELTEAELAELVGQLEQTSATLADHPDPAAACAAGYEPVSAQNPNMGVHFVNVGLIADGFDPANPEMLLYGSEDGLGLTRTEIGDCGEDGSWTGPELEIVGSAFFIDISDEHPDGFAGPLDNWHVHYNSCAGAELDNMGSQAACDQFGGTYFDVQPNWMIHAYAAPEYDSQTGVFGMWNDSIWPIGGDAERPDLNADVRSEISDFTFGDVTAEVGDQIVFTNRDQMPHTVAEGRFAEPGDRFESDFLATDDSFALTFDEPGEYDYYCTLHPTMQGQVIVN